MIEVNNKIFYFREKYDSLEICDWDSDSPNGIPDVEKIEEPGARLNWSVAAVSVLVCCIKKDTSRSNFERRPSTVVASSMSIFPKLCNVFRSHFRPCNFVPLLVVQSYCRV